MSELQSSPVSDAFRKPPAMAGYFKERAEQMEQAQTQEQGFQPVNEDATRQVDVAPSYQTQQPSRQQSNDAYNAQLQAQLMTQRDALMKQVQEQQNQLAAYADAYTKLSTQNAEKAWEQEISGYPEMEDLEAVDPADAQRITKMAARALAKPLAAMQQELANQRTASQDSARQYQAHLEDIKQRQRAQAVLKDHPDFFDMYTGDPAFKQFLNGHEDGSSWSREQLAIAELQRGNPKYVSNLITRYKQTRPDGAAMRGVPPVQVARAGGGGGSSGRPSRLGYTLHDINNLMQTRQISHDQYRALLNELRESGELV